MQATYASKMDAVTVEYTHLLTSQLESQRRYFEDLLAEQGRQHGQQLHAVQSQLDGRQEELESARRRHVPPATAESMLGLIARCLRDRGRMGSGPVPIAEPDPESAGPVGPSVHGPDTCGIVTHLAVASCAQVCVPKRVRCLRAGLPHQHLVPGLDTLGAVIRADAANPFQSLPSVLRGAGR